MTSRTKTTLWIVGGVGVGFLLIGIVVLLGVLWFSKTVVETLTLPEEEAAKAAFALAARAKPPDGYVSSAGFITPCTDITISCREIGGQIKYEAVSEQAQNATPEEACATFAQYVAANGAQLQVSIPDGTFDNCAAKFTPDGTFTLLGEVRSPEIAKETETDSQGYTPPNQTRTAQYRLAHHFRYPSKWVITVIYS